MPTRLWVVAAFITSVILIIRARGLARARELARLRAAWGLPSAREHKMDAILESHRSRAAAPGEGPVLDDRTWSDLLLDDVFVACDRAESTLGQHALYHRLRSAPTARHLEAFDALVTRMTDDVSARERAQLALSRLSDPHGYDLWWIGQREVLAPRAWHIAFPGLALTALAVMAAAPFQPALWPLLGVIVVARIGVGYIADQRVSDVAAAFRQLAPVIATGQALSFLDGVEIDPIVAPLRTDAPGLGRLKTIARWVSGDPFMLSVSPNMVAVLVHSFVSVIYDYLNFVFMLDANGVYFGAAELRQRGDSVLRVMAAAGDVDAAISVASYRAGRPRWTRPLFQPPGSTVEADGICHPLIAEPVPNSLAMAPGRGVLVTGSNMSGKSTLLRTIGVNAVLAQTIHTCRADKYVAPVLSVRSCIGRADDLIAGKSYYIVEVESLLELVQASQEKATHLFLLDEMFRGTNAVERIAAGQAVLRALVGRGDTRHVVLAATHDGELVDLLAGQFDAVHFGDDVADDGIVFDYRLRAGRATTRNAIALLKLKGAPEQVIRDALSCAESLDRERRLLGRTL